MDLTSEQRMTILAAFLADARRLDFFLLTFCSRTSPRSSASRCLRSPCPVPDAGDAVRRSFIRPTWRPLGRKPAPCWISCYRSWARSPLLAEPHDLPDPARCSARRHGGEWVSAVPCDGIHTAESAGAGVRILQCGYPTGFLLAAIAYGLLFGRTFGDYTIGWRAMFLLSVLPAFLVLFIRSGVPESPAFEASKAHAKPPLWETIPSTGDWSSTWSC